MLSSSITSGGSSAADLQALRSHWPWLLALGLGMVLVGSIAIRWACLTTITVAATWLFGFVLLACGITEIINAFGAGRWGGTLLHLFIGIDLIFNGWSWIMLALGLRNVPPAEPAAGPA